MLSEREFFKELRNLPKTIYSKRGDASYTEFNVEGDTLYFKRVNTEKNWQLDIKQLYHIYQTNDFINTSVIKSITKGRTNSPSVAVLMSLGFIDNKGMKI
jgi:hypothetical protein